MYLPSAMQADISRGMSRMDPFSERRCCAARTCHTCAQNKICQTAERLDDVSMRRYMQCSSERARQKTILKLSKCARRNTHQESHNGRQAHAFTRSRTPPTNLGGLACLMLSSFCNSWLKFFPASVRAPSISRVSSVRWLFAAGPAPAQVSLPPPRRDWLSASRSALSCVRS